MSSLILNEEDGDLHPAQRHRSSQAAGSAGSAGLAGTAGNAWLEVY